MLFSGLPWFTREEIIKLVIEDEAKYCRVSREWLGIASAIYGSLLIDSKPPEFKKSSALFAKYIKKLELKRLFNVDWDFVYSHRNVTDVAIGIEKEISPDEYEELITKCIQLSPLEKLEFRYTDIPRFDFCLLIKTNQLHLKRLSIATHIRSGHLALKNMMFLKLHHLTMGISRPTDIQKLTKGMPNLKILCLAFTRHDETILFRDFEMPDLVKLDLVNLTTGVKIKVNLTNLPNIKNLVMMGDCKFVGNDVFEKVVGLYTNQSPSYLQKFIHPRLTKLRSLNLDILLGINLSKLRNLLQRLTKLTKVRLSLKCPDTLENLPPGPYAITELVLDGVFFTSSYLLHWLNSSFKLQALDLHACYLKDHAFRGVPKFQHLSRLTIRVRSSFVDLFSKSFNKKTHPHINFIAISSCKCNGQGGISFMF